jgi:8-oxo-dGTP pyrophosphatase MutT (NUDIX family)
MIAVFVVRHTANGGHEFLQLRRAAGEWMAGTWQIVRGTIEPGETAVAAARRELLEETALSPIEFYALCSVESFFLPARDAILHVPVFCAFVDPAHPVVLNDEHDACRWVPAAQMAAAITWASERAVLQEVLDDILGNGLAKDYLSIDVQ